MTEAIRTIVVATQNPHKVQEIAAIFAKEKLIGVRLVTLVEAGFTKIAEPNEVGTSFIENATIKAISYAIATRMECLADDSGLEVDALGGKPGVISSHYASDGSSDSRETGAGRGARDSANNARVLRELQGVPKEKRGARFRCVMVLAKPNGNGNGASVLHVAQGTFEGMIGEPPRVPSGGDGFGYDPLFLVAPEFAKTGAELVPAEKDAISHRAQAAKLMACFLRQS